MFRFRRFAPIVLLLQVSSAFAQAPAFLNPEAAIDSLFVNEKYFELDSTRGDLNSDGIEDLAMILFRVEGATDESRQIRLVVLAGMSDGRLSPLAVSSSYCRAQKFYNLEAKGSSLFVSEVHSADENGVVRNTLQFQFNSLLGDLELIGRESFSESFRDSSCDRTSVNYRAGTSIDYERVRGCTKGKRKSRFAVSQLATLNGFDCDSFFDETPY